LTLSEAIDRLLDRVKLRRNTYSSYRNSLEPFKVIFGDRDCADFTAKDIEEFLSGLSGTKATKHLKFMHIKIMFDEAQKTLIDSGQPVKWANPCMFLRDEFKLPVRKRASNRICDDTRQITKTLKVKYILIYELATQMGLQVSEIISIKPSDLICSGEACALVFHNMTDNKDEDIRNMPFALYQKLLEYIEKNDIKKNDRIFPLTRQAVWYLFKSKGITPTDLRRYHSSKKHSKMGVYVKPISVYLKHKSEDTTARYKKI